MNQFEEHHNIRIGDRVYVKLFFDKPNLPPANFANIGSFMSGQHQVLETRSGIIESIDDLDASLFGMVFHVLYPNGKTHGCSIGNMRPDGILLVIDD